MNDPYTQLSGRRARAAAQLIALVGVAAAVGLATVDNGLARAGSALVLGCLVLVALKIGLVALQRQNSSPPVIRVEASTLSDDVAGVAAIANEARSEVERLASTIDPLSEELAHQESLSRRSEPVVAEFVTLRHEVTYLREAVDRLRAERDV